MLVDSTHGVIETKIVPDDTGQTSPTPATVAALVRVIDAQLRGLKQQVAALERLREELVKGG